jgi:DNA-binding NtrC family response regulator
VAKNTAAGGGGHILVVDDDQGVRRSTAVLLRHGGHVVSEAEDNEAALRILGEEEVILLVLDLGLPAGEGLRLLDMLDDPPPVILTSGSGDVQVDDPRVSVFLAKPYSPPRLLELARSLTGAPRSQEQPRPSSGTE